MKASLLLALALAVQTSALRYKAMSPRDGMRVDQESSGDVGASDFVRKQNCALSQLSQAGDPRLVFSLTTIKQRIALVKPVLDSLIEQQTRAPDAVYLAVPPDVKELPEWLEKYDERTCRPGVLKVLRMESDYGPASKLLAALKEGMLASSDTIIVYGDDDMIYGDRIMQHHLDAQRSATSPTAFATRLITPGLEFGVPNGKVILEATGTISVRASAVPGAVFSGEMAESCRLSDDFWISHHLGMAGVKLALLPGDCKFFWASQTYSENCGAFRGAGDIAHIAALSEVSAESGNEGWKRGGGDWKTQLQRYGVCQKSISQKDL